MAEQLKNQIAALQRKLARVTLSNAPNTAAAGSSGASRRRRRRARASLGSSGMSNTTVIANPVQNPNPRAQGRQRRRGASNSIMGGEGSIRVARKEFVMEIKGQMVSYFELWPNRLAWLKGIAGNFDRYRWISVDIEYKPAVGTTANGLIAFGPDWDGGATETTYVREDVLAATPVCEVPVWQPAKLALPASKLQTRKEYRLRVQKNWDDVTQFDCFPCFLMVACTGTKDTSVGELWVHYNVEMFGTRKAA